jgi:hypothetical protein
MIRRSSSRPLVLSDLQNLKIWITFSISTVRQTIGKEAFRDSLLWADNPETKSEKKLITSIKNNDFRFFFSGRYKERPNFHLFSVIFLRGDPYSGSIENLTSQQSAMIY